MLPRWFRSSFAAFLALALLALTVGEGWHHHAESEKQDCAYCQFVATGVDSAHVAPPAHLGPQGYFAASIPAPIVKIQQVVLLFPSGRSPPQAS